MEKIKSFLNKVFSLGTKYAKTEKDAQKIVYLNKGIIIGTFLYLPNLFVELAVAPLHATLLNLCYVFCAAIAVFINSFGRFSASRNFIMISLDLILLTACFTEGTQTGNHLIYSALILIYPSFVTLDENKREIVYLFVFSAMCATIAVLVAPEKGMLAPIDTESAAIMFKASFAVTFGLSAILAVIIFIVNRDKGRELTEAKEIAEQSAVAKLQFISNMSHELRTPLNGIIGTTNLLQMGNHTSQQQEQFELLKYSSSHMLHLINEVLDFSKIDANKLQLNPKPFRLDIFVKNIYSSFAPQFESKGLYFKLFINDESLKLHINGDDVRLGQILNNLLSNALKFTSKGGVELSVTTQQQAANKVMVSFDIADTGIGIRKEKLDSVFESFTQADLNTTRKYGGTGLGLTISKKLAQLFKTDIFVTSKEGVGSKFWFTPIFELVETINEPTIERPAAIQSLHGLKVLLAEDNNINMLIARKFLLKWGVTVSEAKNGKEAIEISKTQQFDLLLLDLEMPEADGYTALAEIRKQHKDIYAIAFTAALFDNFENTIKQKGFNDYILKPFVPEDLNAKLFAVKQSLAVSV
jgi:signal transduction histidine kinase/CheY-like chemotaxis protein